MVHALDEIRGVLAPGGLLVDLRPLLDRWPVEVSWTNGHAPAGRATDLAEPLADDEAANAAMGALASSGAFQREREETFPLYYYWDTPKEMEAYIAEEWSDVIAVEEDAWNRLRSMWASASADARVRLQIKMWIARYRKEDGAHDLTKP
jgi:hypothetical protein